MQPQTIKQLIETHLPDSIVHVEGDGAHFTAIVICDLFIGKTRVQKQQLVYDTVKNHLISGTLHALSIKTFTHAEWQAQSGQ